MDTKPLFRGADWSNLELVRQIVLYLLYDAPVTGGNVSFYNENPAGAVYPTPVIGMVGIVEQLEHVTTSWFKRNWLVTWSRIRHTST